MQYHPFIQLRRSHDRHLFYFLTYAILVRATGGFHTHNEEGGRGGSAAPGLGPGPAEIALGRTLLRFVSQGAIHRSEEDGCLRAGVGPTCRMCPSVS